MKSAPPLGCRLLDGALDLKWGFRSPGRVRSVPVVHTIQPSTTAGEAPQRRRRAHAPLAATRTQHPRRAPGRPRPRQPEARRGRRRRRPERRQTARAAGPGAATSQRPARLWRATTCTRRLALGGPRLLIEGGGHNETGRGARQRSFAGPRTCARHAVWPVPAQCPAPARQTTPTRRSAPTKWCVSTARHAPASRPAPIPVAGADPCRPNDLRRPHDPSCAPISLPAPTSEPARVP